MHTHTRCYISAFSNKSFNFSFLSFWFLHSLLLLSSGHLFVHELTLWFYCWIYTTLWILLSSQLKSIPLSSFTEFPYLRHVSCLCHPSDCIPVLTCLPTPRCLGSTPTQEHLVHRLLCVCVKVGSPFKKAAFTVAKLGSDIRSDLTLRWQFVVEQIYSNKW